MMLNFAEISAKLSYLLLRIQRYDEIWTVSKQAWI